VRGHGEAEAHLHARGVVLDRRIDETLQLGEGHDAIELRLDLPAGHAEDDPVEGDVLAPRQLGMEAGPDLDEGAQPTVHHEGAGGGYGDAREDLEQSALPRAIRAYQPQNLAPLEGEGDVPEGPELLAGLDLATEQTRGEALHLVSNRRDVPAAAQPIALRDLVELDGDIRH